MKDKDYFDNVLKSVIDDSISNIEVSRDIFSEAWNKKEKEVSKRKYFSVQYMKKAVLIPVCCAALSFVGVFTISPGARAAAQEILRTIFILDKSGNIVEKSEETKIPVFLGPVFITDENKKDMERRLDFKVNLPEEIGSYSYEKIDNYVYRPGVIIMAEDVKYKDSDDVLDKLTKSIDDDKSFEELNKDYVLTRGVVSRYVDNQGHKFQLTLFKEDGNSKSHYKDDQKEVNIDDIKCKISQGQKVNYNVKEDEAGDGVTDMENKPISTDERYDMRWNYNGVNYSLYIGKNSSDVDAAIEFATEYINILKQK